MENEKRENIYKELDRIREQKIADDRVKKEVPVNELDEYLKELAESELRKAESSKNYNKNNKSVEPDFVNSLWKSGQNSNEVIKESFDKAINDLDNKTFNSEKSFYKEPIAHDKGKVIWGKTDSFYMDMNKELEKSKSDKELYQNLEAIKEYYDRQFKSQNQDYKEYSDLIKQDTEGVLSYEQRMSGFRIHSDSMRNIAKEQKEVVNIVKGETKNQQILKKAEKSMDYVANAEKKINDIKSQKKFFDIRGNLQKNQMIREIRKEIKRHEELLITNGISSKEDFKQLKNEVKNREDMVKEIIARENERLKKERESSERSNQLLKQSEQQKVEKKEQQKQQEHKKSKMVLER